MSHSGSLFIRSLFAFFFLFSLVLGVSPAVYAAAQPDAANLVVSPPAMQGWVPFQDLPAPGVVGLVTGPAVPPAGQGSARLKVTASDQAPVFGTGRFMNVRLADLTELSYWTYVQPGAGTVQAPALTMAVDYEDPLNDLPYEGRLTFEPYMNGTIAQGVWQKWDALNGAAAKWWSSKAPFSTTCPQAAPCTLAEVFASWPDVRITNLLGFKAGSGWTNFDGNFDKLTIAMPGITKTFDFEPPAVTYVDDNWVSVVPASDPDGAGPAIAFGVDAFAKIQDAIDAVTPGGTVKVAAGAYVEDLQINKAVNLVGPNNAINPNTGTRSAEAILYPATSKPNPNDVCSVMAYVSVSGVSIRGFTFNGDNPLLHSGILIGTADVDACEIIAGYEGAGDITIENNILKYSTFTGIDFYNYTNSAATSGNFIRYNLIQDIGETTYNWGIGVLVYNNFYADITHNVLTRVRTGIQTGNFFTTNPGTTGSISDNQIGVWRLGIFHNLAYANASPLTLANNTITAENYPGATRWNGILLASIQGTVTAAIEANTIVIPVTVSYPAPGYTAGYNVWNVTTNAPITIHGGTVTGGNYGIWVNNYTGYNSNSASTAVRIDGVNISNASMAGIFVQDDLRNTNGATVDAEILNSPISNSGVGILIEGDDATAAGSCNQISLNASGVENNNLLAVLNFEKNWWGDVSGPSGSGLGSGDTVSTNVGYKPWNTDTTCTAFTSNIAPVAHPQSVSTLEDTPIDIILTGTDADGAVSSYVVVGGPAHGELSGTAPVLTYTPNSGYSGPDSFTFKTNDGIADSAVAAVSITVTAIPRADLAVSHTAAPAVVAPNATWAITLGVANSGPADAANLSLTDTLPDGVSFVSAVGTSWTCSQAAGVVHCTLPSLASGASSSVTITLKAPAAPGLLTNQAVVASDVDDPAAANNTSSASIIVAGVPVTGLTFYLPAISNH